MERNQTLENCNCNETKLNLIKNIIENDCDKVSGLLSKNVNFSLSPMRSIIIDYPKKISEIYKMLYDSDSAKPSKLTKIFRIKASLFDHKNGLVVHLVSINNNFDLIFEKGVGNYWKIKNEDELEPVGGDFFRRYRNNYDSGIGGDSDSLLYKLTSKNYDNNTREINIKYEGNFDKEKIMDETYIEFHPSVSINHSLRFTLMMRLVDKDSNGNIPMDPNFEDNYYDDFCLKPPGC